MADFNNQRRMGGAGFTGASTGDSSGTGVNKIPGKDLSTKFKRGALSAGDISAVAAPVTQAISGTAQQIGSNVMEKGLFPVVGEGVKTLGSALGEGAARFNERISSALPSPEATGKFLFGPNASLPSFKLPESTETINTKPNLIETKEPTTPTIPTDNTGLGTFNTPTGGSATVTKPGGGIAFTPAQQSSLQTIINRETDPGFKARLAEQAAIVDARREQTRLGDIRRANEDSASIDKEVIDSFIRNNPGTQGAAHAAQLRLGQQMESTTKSNEYDIKRQVAEQEAQSKGTTESQKARSENLKNYYSALSENAKAFGTPSQRFQIAKSHFGTVTDAHLPDILGTDFAEYAQLEKPQDKRDYLTKLGIGL